MAVERDALRDWHRIFGLLLIDFFTGSPFTVDVERDLSQPDNTSALLGQLFERLEREGFAMSFTMEDFQRQYAWEHFSRLTPEEQREALKRLSPEQRREVLQALSPEERLEGLSPEQIRQYLDQLAAGRATQPRKPRRKP